MPATKNAPVARKNAKKVAAAKAEPAKRTRKQPEPTPVVAAHINRNAQGRIVQDLATKQLLTIAQLAERTGFTVTRVEEHVNYEISKGRSKLNGKKQVVVISQPIRRNAS